MATLADKATGKNVSTTKDDDGKKESLNIKIHLDLKVKVKLELDAEIYGDVVIGLLWEADVLYLWSRMILLIGFGISAYPMLMIFMQYMIVENS